MSPHPVSRDCASDVSAPSAVTLPWTWGGWIPCHPPPFGMAPAMRDDRGTDMISYLKDGHWKFAYGEGSQFHRTLAGAFARAEQMRAAKLKSLTKEIDRVKKLTF